jgi:hypothetical protein
MYYVYQGSSDYTRGAVGPLAVPARRIALVVTIPYIINRTMRDPGLLSVESADPDKKMNWRTGAIWL